MKRTQDHRRSVRCRCHRSGGPALRARPGQGQAAQGGGARRSRVYDFTGDTIEGDLVKPDGDFLDTRKFANHTSLIRLRKDFIQEIVKSAEDL